MCIRDSFFSYIIYGVIVSLLILVLFIGKEVNGCLLYTSDAADDLTRVDIGGCRFFQAEDGIRDLVRSRGLGDVYKRQFFLLYYLRSYSFLTHFSSFYW